MNELAVRFGSETNLVGIFTSSPQKRAFIAIFLNSGLIHHVGPNRVYVKLARKLSEVGVESLRFDFSGIGDSSLGQWTSSGEEKEVSEVKMAMDFLTNLTGINKFVLVGLCSGASAAFKTALVDQRIVGCILLNGIHLQKYEYDIFSKKASRRSRVRYFLKNLLYLSKWKRLLSGRSKFYRKWSFQQLQLPRLKSFSKIEKAENSTESQSLSLVERHEILLRNKVNVLYIFSEGSTSYDLYKLTLKKMINKHAQFKNLSVSVVEKSDHTFTLVDSQKRLIEAVLNWTEDLSL